MISRGTTHLSVATHFMTYERQCSDRSALVTVGETG
jgi:hypothetical protein